MSRDLCADALAIFQAGIEAVRSDRLVMDNVRVDGDWLLVGDSCAEPLELRLADIGRIAVVGAGKAGAGMAAGLLHALGPQVLADKRVTGWINVPADCVPAPTNPTRKRGNATSPTRERGNGDSPAAIHLHPARPAGVNEPTAAGVFGAEQILNIVSSLAPNDLCICLISGGGSALLPAPVAGVSLAEKQALTRLLSAGGANIQELNTVRKQLSRIKGGRLARQCGAGRLISLLISDVLGDPLDVIASGPTVPDSHSPHEALEILRRYAGSDESLAPVACAYLRQQVASGGKPSASLSMTCQVTNLVIGNNAVAVDAAGVEAERRGYSHAMSAATTLEGAAEDIGQHLAQMTLRMQSEAGPDCLITGGEPTVKLAPAELRGKGGRNQQLVLAALTELMSAEPGTRSAEQNDRTHSDTPRSAFRVPRFALLSGGTDGEDGPTDAAGAIIDSNTFAEIAEKHLDPADFLLRNDAYTFFEHLGCLIKTGPTHTNVCDLRVVVVEQ